MFRGCFYVDVASLVMMQPDAWGVVIQASVFVVRPLEWAEAVTAVISLKGDVYSLYSLVDALAERSEDDLSAASFGALTKTLCQFRCSVLGHCEPGGKARRLGDQLRRTRQNGMAPGLLGWEAS